MDSSFGKNAANRVEESYGDAKNLRARHPQAALGFVYALSAVALESEPDIAEWLIDLLAKLGREEDAYDAVALILPDLTPESEAPGVEEDVAAGPLEPGASDDENIVESDAELRLAQELVPHEVHHMRPVRLRRSQVPAALDPGRFFTVMCDELLERTPVNFHADARRLRREAGRP